MRVYRTKSLFLKFNEGNDILYISVFVIMVDASVAAAAVTDIAILFLLPFFGRVSVSLAEQCGVTAWVSVVSPNLSMRSGLCSLALFLSLSLYFYYITKS